MTASRLFHFLALACYVALASISLANALQFYVWRMDPALDDLAAIIQLTLLVAANAALAMAATLVAWGIHKRLPGVLRWRRAALVLVFFYALWLVVYGERRAEGAVLAILATLGFVATGRALAVRERPSLIPVSFPIVETPSGLRYQDLHVGIGPLASPGRTAVLHYTGFLEDGTPFDSSLERGQPFEMVVGQGRAIKGWDEGVATMHMGGRRRLFVPPGLGYGAAGFGSVPGGASLVFDLELIDVR